jgi:cytochrome oxidase Cu insertion factor (SCO1/SenC/PrrC family)
MRRLLALSLVVAASAALGYGPGARAEEPKMSDVKVGDTPGAFALNDHEGKAVKLGDGKGHGWFVLAFFPKAMTGG